MKKGSLLLSSDNESLLSLSVITSVTKALIRPAGSLGAALMLLLLDVCVCGCVCVCFIRP